MAKKDEEVEVIDMDEVSKSPEVLEDTDTDEVEAESDDDDEVEEDENEENGDD